MLRKGSVWVLMFLLVSMFALPVWAGNGSGSGSTSVTTSSDSSDEDSDQPDWAGTSGNENKPGSGNEEPGVAKGDLYGDLYIIVRDDNGAPILYEWIWDDAGPVSYYVSATGFVQPIAVEGTLEEFDGLVPLDIEGEIPEAYAEYAQEVEFGRLNVARAPQDFLNRAYEEAIININAAEFVTVDPAGRLLMINGDEEKAIDAPRENLALYQRLMLYGHLAGLHGNNFDPILGHLLATGDPTLAEIPTSEDLDQAAAFLAAAADKTGSINVDLVVYLNSILGINGETTTAYFNFNDYGYQRQLRRGQPNAVVLRGPVFDQGKTWFYIGEVEIIDEVFMGHVGDPVYKARGFAKASDDALKVISYIHNWAVPEYDE